jgi:gamma-glutamyltranspeptidase
MNYTRRGLNGMVSAPHHLAAEAGADVLRNGGNAVEAMVSAAAAIAVVYPHMNSIGGDGFWLISEPGKPVRAIEACGPAASLATPEFYKDNGLSTIPDRGPKAALTVAGTISGWEKALELAKHYGGKVPLEALLAPAIQHARIGIAVTQGQEQITEEKLQGLKDVPGFSENYLNSDSTVPKEGDVFKQPNLANSLEQLSKRGLNDFYRGDLARSLAADLEKQGSPLRLSDLEAFNAKEVAPLVGDFGCGKIFNMPPPTQGISSLMILGLFEKLGVKDAETFDHIHGLVEATKQAFILRNRYVCDPAYMTEDPNSWLSQSYLSSLRNKIDRSSAMPWPHVPKPGDTIWMGCADNEGRVVSFIQSIYWEYGSGLVADGTGIVWQNRGTSFSLEQSSPNSLRPGKRPFHTLNPALTHLKDGRVLAYGTMGGEGQPQTQAAIFTRHVLFGQPLQEAVTAPRWLLGRTWGEETTSLKLESRFDPALIDRLQKAGHDVEVLEPFSSVMGHAGAVCVSPSGVIQGASDPRSDGSAVAL